MRFHGIHGLGRPLFGLAPRPVVVGLRSAVDTWPGRDSRCRRRRRSPSRHCWPIAAGAIQRFAARRASRRRTAPTPSCPNPDRSNGRRGTAYVVGIGRQQHMMELAGGVAQFDVVVMVGQRHAQATNLLPQPVQSGRLDAKLCVVLVFRTTPADRAGIGDDDPRAHLLGSLGDGDDRGNVFVNLFGPVKRAADVQRACNFQPMFLQQGNEPIDLLQRELPGSKPSMPDGRPQPVRYRVRRGSSCPRADRTFANCTGCTPDGASLADPLAAAWQADANTVPQLTKAVCFRK